MYSTLRHTTAVIALMTLPLVPLSVHAQSNSGQQSQSGQQTQSQDQQSQSQNQQGSAQTQGSSGSQGAQQEDVLVAKVGDAEIRRSDILGVIGMLPQPLQAQPPEMLIPLALDQLVLRELVLQEAQKAGLDNSSEVQQLVDEQTRSSREDAMVHVWLDQELGKAVTDEAVKSTYDAVKANTAGEFPALDQVRPQIENQLRQQAFMSVSERLKREADVTLYGPDGKPISQ